MADERFSTDRPPLLDSDLPPVIRAEVSRLRQGRDGECYAVVDWNPNYIAVGILMPVELPARGPVGGIDIRPKEPLLFLFSKTAYPYEAPLVLSDRKDFPQTTIPHLNPRDVGAPASLCLHRGRLDDWFSQHSLSDLIDRARTWLSDAASNLLQRAGDAFEPLRIQSTSCYVILDSQSLASEITLLDPTRAGGYSFPWYDLLANPGLDPFIRLESYAIRFRKNFASTDVLGALRAAIEHLEKHDGEKGGKATLGILAWPGATAISAHYNTDLPRTLAELTTWAANYGVNLQPALDEFLTSKLQLLGGVPITVALRRPAQVLGTTTNLEFVSFIAAANGENASGAGGWKSDTPLHKVAHRKPLTPDIASRLSGIPVPISSRRLQFGAGALGSKVALHLARSGAPQLHIVDDDRLEPHNLVRHALLSDSLGKNKAESLAGAINGLYPGMGATPASFANESATKFLLETRAESLSEYGCMLDMTAAPLVKDLLCRKPLQESPRCIRGEIAHEGRLGLLAIEGPERNPRLDDIEANVFQLAMQRPNIAAWLAAERAERQRIGSPLEGLQIGQGCSADTTQMADHVVSFHAANMAASLAMPPASGLLQIGTLSNPDQRSRSVHDYEVPAVEAKPPINDSAWSVRIASTPAHLMRQELTRAGRSETGGILIGYAHTKRRCVYITEALPESPDSVGTPDGFQRGTIGYAEAVRQAENLTGILGYVGEWHTHPGSQPRPSPTDHGAARQLAGTLGWQLPVSVQLIVGQREWIASMIGPEWPAADSTRLVARTSLSRRRSR